MQRMRCSKRVHRNPVRRHMWNRRAHIHARSPGMSAFVLEDGGACPNRCATLQSVASGNMFNLCILKFAVELPINLR